MPARPAILVGLGTSGSSIVGRVYRRFEALRNAGLVSPRQCQFISIDADQASAAGDEYVAGLPGPNLDNSYTNTDGLRAGLARSDPFFPAWWYESFPNPGPANFGCGT